LSNTFPVIFTFLAGFPCCAFAIEKIPMRHRNSNSFFISVRSFLDIVFSVGLTTKKRHGLTGFG
jgi:hypothetical protein